MKKITARKNCRLVCGQARPTTQSVIPNLVRDLCRMETLKQVQGDKVFTAYLFPSARDADEAALGFGEAVL